jgi:hypothetical protein
VAGAIAIGLAVIASVVVLGLRRWRAAREWAARPGAAIGSAIPVRRFDHMDRILAHRRCRCGEALGLRGEDSREVDGRRLRVVVLHCSECERDERVYFDVTEVFH